MFERINSLGLGATHKRSLFKVAVDLMKADNQIHGNEIALLGQLQEACDMPASGLEMMHYVSLQQALDNLLTLSDEARSEVVACLERLISIDNNIDSREMLLFSAVRLALLPSSSAWSRVVTSSNMNAECAMDQMVYLEQELCESVYRIMDDKYQSLLLTKALSDAGYKFFFLPRVIAELQQRWSGFDESGDSLGLLRRSLEFIAPTGDHSKIINLRSVLNEMTTSTFYKVVSSRYGIGAEQVGFGAFVMVKIQDDYLLNDDGEVLRHADFLCLDVSEAMVERILQFLMAIARPNYQLSYEGYYRLLYDYLGSESKIMSSILVDRHNDFILRDLDSRKVRFESAPQAKSFYLLLLRYGRAGIDQRCFNAAIDYLTGEDVAPQVESGQLDAVELKERLIGIGTDWAYLIYNLMTLYDAISTKDEEQRSFVGRIVSILRHRSSLKNYLNGGFCGVYDLDHKESYCVQFSNSTRSYYVDLSPSLIWVETAEGIVPLREWSVFKKLR